MKKILFLGQGHLGKFFVNQNIYHSIVGTKRNLEKNSSSMLKYHLGESWNGPTAVDVAIISFPPVENYLIHLQKLLNDLGSFKQLIFISSTSVYGSGEIDELSKKNGTSRNSQKLIACEDLIKKQPNHVIIRPAGLVDELRHPKNFFKKTKRVSKANSNVNLVHTYDVAAFIYFVIDKNIKNEEFNLVCDDHPTKEEFYGRFHDDLEFDSEGSKIRIIDNTKSKKVGFKYKFNNLNWSYDGQVYEKNF